MHELSIVASIVEIARDHVSMRKAEGVDKIELEIGELAGIDWKALDFVWDVGVQSSVLENAERNIVRIPGEMKCMECNATFNSNSLYTNCPQCNSYFSEVLRGKELRVKSLTIT